MDTTWVPLRFHNAAGLAIVWYYSAIDFPVDSPLRVPLDAIIIRPLEFLCSLVDILARDEPSNSGANIPEMSPYRFRTSFGNIITVTLMATITAKIARNDKRPNRATKRFCAIWTGGCGRAGSGEKPRRRSLAASPSSGRDVSG
jgi:hypothetical protein